MTCMLSNKKKLAACAAAGAAAFGAQGVADADFTGSYAHANWTLTAGGDGGATNQTTTTLTLLGNHDGPYTGVLAVGGLGTVTYLTTAAATGTVSFDWVANPNGDSGSYDFHGVYINGVFTTIGTNAGPLAANTTFGVTAGDSFGFFVHSIDANPGFGSDGLNVDYSNFSAPEAVIPEPSAIALLALGTVGGLGLRRRRS